MFNARPWESGNDPAHPNPPYKKHDFGYTVGGPVYIPIITTPTRRKLFSSGLKNGGAKRILPQSSKRPV